MTELLDKLTRWGAAREDVRAMILTSTRTVPGGQLDLFSDYDVILAVRDTRPFYEDRTWLGDFGPVLVVYRDPYRDQNGYRSFAYITQYEAGLKIDFTLMPVGLLANIAAEPKLPEDLDVGYQVLFDKDGLAEELQPPTYQAHIPSPPSLDEYLTHVEVFFHEATYVAKHLWRADLLPAKYCLDQMMKGEMLHEMLIWRLELDHNWSLKPGNLGKGLKKYLSSERWLALERTYVGPDLEDNWVAMFRTIALYRRVAREVGLACGHEYPEDLDRRAVDYLAEVARLPRDAKTFPS